MKTIPFLLEHVHHILQPHEVAGFCALLEKHVGPVVLDLETTGLDEHRWSARVVTIAITLPHVDIEGDETAYPDTYVVGLSHPDCALYTEWRKHLTKITLAIHKSGCDIIGQNIRFDVRWLTKHTGINLATRIIADTGMGYHLLDENRTAALKPRTMAEFEIDSWIDFSWADIEREQKKDPRYPFCPLLAERVDYFTMAMYNARDTYWTWRGHQLHQEEMGLTETAREDLLSDGHKEAIEALRLGDYYTRVSVPAIRTLTALEQQGLLLDRDWCTSRLIELDKITSEQTDIMIDRLEFHRTWAGLTDAQEEALAGYQSFQPTALWFKAWAEVMCDNGDLQVVAMTEEGAVSWAKAGLKRLSRQGKEMATALLEFRTADKEAQFIRSWLEFADETGRLHSTYNYYKVVTGRLSSENPNSQQIPRGAKNAFIASPGYVLVSADYSQIELRVAAHIAKCEPMIEAFRQGKDLHKLMAARITGVEYEEVTKEMRQQAKAANFGFLFGMGAEKFITFAADSYDVDFTMEEAEEARAFFFDTWTGMQQWHNAQRKLARENGYVKSPLGRIRHLPDIYSKTDYYRSRAERQAINSPVQGMASDITLMSASKLRKHFPLIRPVALIHDCTLAEVPAGHAREFAQAIKDTMEGIHVDLERLGCKLLVPLVADVSVGPSWGTCLDL